MARFETQEPTEDEHGRMTHPAWGLIGASRISASGGPHDGQVLFASDLAHRSYIAVRIKRAALDRDHHRDHYSEREQLVEIAMSEAQWASFVSSMNQGTGVPCTIERTQRDGIMPRFPLEPRLQETMDEVSDAAAKLVREVQEAFDKYAEKKNAANLDSLKHKIRNMPSNIKFAADSLTAHTENVVQRARADIEGMVVSQAKALGIDPTEIQQPMLTEGDRPAKPRKRPGQKA